MKLFVFSSYSLTNIWAGIGAQQWAVSKKQSENKSIRTKAKKVPIGSFGIFYCTHLGMGIFTTPFLIYSKPDPEKIIKNIWPKEWSLPFKIFPLGSPEKYITASKLASKLPSLKGKSEEWKSLFHVQGLTVFVPSEISDIDLEVIISELADI